MHIQVFTGGGQPLGDQYMLSMLVDLWHEAGHIVTIGRDTFDGDIGVVHIDRTIVDPSMIPVAPHGRPFVNGAAWDISKRRVSASIVERGDGYDGPVILKTNDNAEGSGEREGTSRLRWGRLRRRLTDVLPWTLLRTLPKSYPVLASTADVPAWVWRRTDLVVEQFLAEREGAEYILRNWIFFGDAEYSAKLYSKDPVVKMSNIDRYEYLFDVPQSLRDRRRELGIDFGKFDYVMRDGEAILLDANKTPVSKRTPESPTPNIRRLAKAITEFGGEG